MTAETAKKKGIPAKLGWLWSLLSGFFIGALITFVPFYFHALDDWDLADKTTLFPRELGSIASFYSPVWLVGGIVGALLGLVTWGLVRFYKSQRSLSRSENSSSQ